MKYLVRFNGRFIGTVAKAANRLWVWETNSPLWSGHTARGRASTEQQAVDRLVQAWRALT